MSHFLAFQTWLVNLLGENGAVIAFYGTVLLVVVLVLGTLGLLVGWLKWGRGRKRDLRRAFRAGFHSIYEDDPNLNTSDDAAVDAAIRKGNP